MSTRHATSRSTVSRASPSTTLEVVHPRPAETEWTLQLGRSALVSELPAGLKLCLPPPISPGRSLKATAAVGFMGTNRVMRILLPGSTDIKSQPLQPMRPSECGDRVKVQTDLESTVTRFWATKADSNVQPEFGPPPPPGPWWGEFRTRRVW